MARLARGVAPGLPHHVTQRGDRHEQVFFEDDDYRAYLALIGAAARRSATEVWAYCLIPNHVHFIMVPSHEQGLRDTFAEAHRRYTGRINARFRQTGQGAMDCLLPVVTPTMRACEDFFFNRLSALPGVQEVNSVVSLTEAKFTTALPVG